MDKTFKFSFSMLFTALFMLAGFVMCVSTFIWLCFGGLLLFHNISLYSALAGFGFLCLTIMSYFFERERSDTDE